MPKYICPKCNISFEGSVADIYLPASMHSEGSHKHSLSFDELITTIEQQSNPNYQEPVEASLPAPETSLDSEIKLPETIQEKKEKIQKPANQPSPEVLPKETVVDTPKKTEKPSETTELKSDLTNWWEDIADEVKKEEKSHD